MPAYSYRWVTGADFKNLVELYTEILTKDPHVTADAALEHGLKTNPEVWAPRLMSRVIGLFTQAFQDTKSTLLGLMYSDDTPVGLLRVTLDTPSTASVHDFLLLESYRGRGIASKARVWLEEELQRRGIEEIQCSVAWGNPQGRAFLQGSDGFKPRAVFWTKQIPKIPPVRFDVGGVGAVSDFGDDPARVAASKPKPKRKPATKRKKA